MKDEIMWCVTPSPNPTRQTILHDVAALAPNDVWATGYVDFATGDVLHPSLFLHWNGKTWRIVPSPNFGSKSNFMAGLSERASNDIWAVGTYTNDGPTPRPITMHWDGVEWSVIPTPDIPDLGGDLYSVAAIASNDVWAVGQHNIDYVARGHPQRSMYQERDRVRDEMQPLILHWEGAQWSIVPTPHVEGGGRLSAISPVAPNDIWAVGNYPRQLVMHWDGATWQIVPTLDRVNSWDVVALASDEAWIVGRGTMHWDGTQWNLVTRSTDVFRGVAGVTPKDLWAVGWNDAGPIIRNWNGNKCRAVPLLPRNLPHSQLESITVAATEELWAVGVRWTAHGYFKTLIVHGQLPRPPTRVRLTHSIVRSQHLVFKWRLAECAGEYELEVRQDSPDGRRVIQASQIRATRYETERLEPNHIYYWRVRGCNAVGCGLWSAFRSITLNRK